MAFSEKGTDYSRGRFGRKDKFDLKDACGAPKRSYFVGN